MNDEDLYNNQDGEEEDNEEDVVTMKQMIEEMDDNHLAILEAFRIEHFAQCTYQKGVKGAYKGLSITCARDTLFTVIELPLWDILKKNYRLNYSCNSDVPWYISSGFGALAGSIAGFATTPLDLVKTKLQNCNSNNKTENSWRMLQDIYKKEKKISGFFKGGLSRSLIMGFGGLVFFGGYDFLLNLL